MSERHFTIKETVELFQHISEDVSREDLLLAGVKPRGDEMLFFYALAPTREISVDLELVHPDLLLEFLELEPDNVEPSSIYAISYDGLVITDPLPCDKDKAFQLEEEDLLLRASNLLEYFPSLSYCEKWNIFPTIKENTPQANDKEAEVESQEVTQAETSTLKERIRERDALAQKVSDLKEELRQTNKNISTEESAPNNRLNLLLDETYEHHAPELALAVRTWLSFYGDPENIPQRRTKEYLVKKARSLSPKNAREKSIFSDTTLNRIATVTNPNKTGGAPQTP